MKHVIENNGVFEAYTSKFAIDENGTQHPLVGMSKAQKAAYGIYERQTAQRPDTGPAETAKLHDQPTLTDNVAVYEWTVEPIPAEQISLTRLQFALACLGAGIITASEAEEFASGGVLPQVALDALASIPDETTRTVARIRFRSADRIDRTNEFIPVLQASLGMTEAQVDDLFRAGVAI